MYDNGLIIEGVTHFLLLGLQNLYALMLAQYSFFVIYQQEGYLNIFMNSTALLFLNDFGIYVCAVMKNFIEGIFFVKVGILF